MFLKRCVLLVGKAALSILLLVSSTDVVSMPKGKKPKPGARRRISRVEQELKTTFPAACESKDNAAEQPEQNILGEKPQVNRLQDLFELNEFGRALANSSEKTKLIGMTNSQIYEVTKDMPEYGLEKGDLVYLDKSHGDHLEVVKGKEFAVCNLDGSPNAEKTKAASGRTLLLRGVKNKRRGGKVNQKNFK